MSTFRSADGTEIFYARAGSDPSQPPVLLHHGFGASGEIDWVGPGTVDALVAAGRRVVTLDARGHGRSGRPRDPGGYGLTTMADDVRALLDALGIGQVDLAGYSMGAVVSLITAAREPRVRRLVVGGIGAGAVELGGLDTRVLAPGVLADALLADDPALVADPLAAGFRAFVDSTGSDRHALAAVAVATARHGRLPLELIRVPTLVLAGRDDPLARRPEILAQALSDATVWLVDGDHGGVLHEPAFADALVRFLEGSRPAEADGP